MLPSLSTATVMFSGFVWVGMLTAFGSSTLTVLLITGMVIRKMMSRTNMTSTSGVVLMLFITCCSSPDWPTCIAILLDPQKAFRCPGEGPRKACDTKSRSLLTDGSSRSGGRTGTAGLAGANAGTAYQIGMQVACEVPQGVLNHLVTAQQPVVAHDRRNGDEQTDGGHDQRLTDGTGHLVDARLAGDTDTHQSVQNAPDRAGQTDERRR